MRMILKPLKSLEWLDFSRGSLYIEKFHIPLLPAQANPGGYFFIVENLVD